MGRPAKQKDDVPFEIERTGAFEEPRVPGGLAAPPLQLAPIDPSQEPRLEHGERRRFVPPRLLERRENMLASLFELSHELGTSRDPFAIAELVALNVMGQFGSRRAAVWAWPDDAPDAAATLCAFGVSSERAAVAGTALRGAAETAEPAGSETLVLERPAAVERAGFVLAVPIEWHGARVGAFALGERVGSEAYLGIELEHVSAAARLLGMALENARHHHHLAEVNRRLRRANDDLVETQRLKGEFVANVNHEMRTPITVVMGFLDVLESAGGLNEMQAQAVRSMSTQTKKLSRIVQDLLEYSSLSGGEKVECAPIDASELLRRYAEERRPGVLEGLRSIEVETATFAPRALADVRRLERVLDALVDNACKFTPPGSHVVLRADAVTLEGERWAVIDVEDDGHGIPAERQPGLFDAFRQGDGSSTRTVGGMGLGLALARQNAESMGGAVELDAGYDRGARFRVRLRAA